MAPPADPVRERVEATLHRFADLVTAGPCGLLRTAGRTVAESAGLARTMVNLTISGLLGWEADAGVPPLGTVDGGSGAAAPLRGARPRAVTEPPARAAPVNLAIPGYEDLAASHIVARLDRLTRSELIAIREFEVANRGRRTVVGKVDQLLARS
jgi:hypothetical protein